MSNCFATLETIACQASLFMEFARQEYGSVLPYPSPRDLPNPGTELMFPAWQADSLPMSHLGSLYIFQILISYGLLQDIEYSSLCYSRSLLCIYFIYKSVYLLISNSQFILPLPTEYVWEFKFKI